MTYDYVSISIGAFALYLFIRGCIKFLQEFFPSIKVLVLVLVFSFSSYLRNFFLHVWSLFLIYIFFYIPVVFFIFENNIEFILLCPPSENMDSVGPIELVGHVATIADMFTQTRISNIQTNSCSTSEVAAVTQIVIDNKDSRKELIRWAIYGTLTIFIGSLFILLCLKVRPNQHPDWQQIAEEGRRAREQADIACAIQESIQEVALRDEAYAELAADQALEALKKASEYAEIARNCVCKDC